MQSSSLTFPSKDGTEIFVHNWLPEKGTSPRAVVQIAHGLAEHGARYEGAAEALTQAGFAVFASDHRGHGKTARSESDLGYFADRNGWELVVDDLHQLNLLIKKEFPDLPVFLLGHSMGSFLVQNYMFKYGETIQGALLSGSNGKVGPLRSAGAAVAWLETKRLGPRGRSPLLHFLSFGAYNNAFKPVRTEFDWLSRDCGEVDKYVADPLCGFMATTGLWKDMLHGLGVIEDPEKQRQIPKELPVYIFAGAMDPVGNATKGLDKLLGAYRRAGLNNVTHHYYPGARHETFNETNRAEVIRDMIAWLEKTLENLK